MKTPTLLVTLSLIATLFGGRSEEALHEQAPPAASKAAPEGPTRASA